MKIIKTKKIVILLIIICLLVMAFSFTACKPSAPDNSSGVTIKLIVLDADKTLLYEDEIDTTKSYLYDAFSEFEKLTIETQSTTQGIFLQAVVVNDKKNVRIENSDSQRTFIAIYHNIDNLKYKYLGFDNLQYAGNIYFSSGLGVSELPLIDGATHVMALSTY